MSEQRAQDTTKRDRKLRVVKPDEEAGPEAYAPTAESDNGASAILGNAVMHAAMSWVACCMEQQGESVEVMQLGGGLFDVEVRLADGGSMWLRVRLILEAGPVLSTRVEPVHP